MHYAYDKKRRQHITEGWELHNQEKIKTLGEKEPYKYLEILEADNTKEVEIRKM